MFCKASHASFLFTDQRGCDGVFQDTLPSHPSSLSWKSSPRANGLKELKHKGICSLVFMLLGESKELERLIRAFPKRIHLSGLT